MKIKTICKGMANTSVLLCICRWIKGIHLVVRSNAADVDLSHSVDVL